MARAAVRKKVHVLPWHIERPVFVIAPPRSGSTFLFESLVQFPELTAFTDREGTFIWNHLLPHEKRATFSDAIAPEEFGWWRRRLLELSFYILGLRGEVAKQGYDRALRLIREPRIRYLDKTISNVFRLDLIKEIFPDAAFVYLVRDPRANLASMLTGWCHERLRKKVFDRYVKAAGSEVTSWTYAAPPGWHNMLGMSLPEVCAWSWIQHVEAIRKFRDQGNPGILLRYEDLVEDAPSVVDALADHLGLRVTPEIRDYLIAPPRSRSTLSAHRSGTDRALLASQVDAVLPMVASAAGMFGYRLPGPA